MTYCIYIFKRGIKRGKMCNEKCHLQYIYCKYHLDKFKKTTPLSQSNSSNIEIKIPNTNNINPITINTLSTINPLVPQSEIKLPPQSEIKLPHQETHKYNTTNSSINKFTNNIQIQHDILRDKILNLPTNNTNKSIIFKHYYNMRRTDQNSTEYYKNQLFVDMCLEYPWGKYFNIHNNINNFNNVQAFLMHIQKSLDDEIFSMKSVKNEILNVICKFITNPSSNRNNIALYGPAGVGKSKFIKVLSKILGLPMKTISLGGIKDSSFFLGHGYVYVESGPGKILQNVIDSKIENPIIYFDELDKVSETDNGKDIFSFLCYLTDPTQNDKFSDHYFYGMNFDLSKVFYVFTFNDINKIDKILLDRLNIIHVDTPKHDEIVQILELYCIPEIIKNIGIQYPINFNKDCINYVINFAKNMIDTTVTSGIREYYRIIEKILLELNKHILTNNLIIDDSIDIENELFHKLFSNIKDQLIQNDENTNCSHMYV
jgi:ATP-dependent Lon protease